MAARRYALALTIGVDLETRNDPVRWLNHEQCRILRHDGQSVDKLAAFHAGNHARAGASPDEVVNGRGNRIDDLKAIF